MEAAQAYTDGWMEKQNVVYIYTKEYYSALKRGKRHIFNTDELEDITLSEMSQWRKEMYDSFEVPRVVNFIETESRILVSMGLEGVGRNEEFVFNGTKVLEWMVVMTVKQREYV